MDEQVPNELIPESPVLSPEQALLSFRTPANIGVSLIANEPLVFNPVAAVYDKKGRLWVAEMITYMPDVLATNEKAALNQIVVLSDTNNDGVFDKRTVVLDKLVLPRALAFAPNGLLWADNTTLFYSEIIEQQGEFTVTFTHAVDAQYAAKGNIEHKPNGLLYSLDNWYYNAKAAFRYRTYPLKAVIPDDSNEVYRNETFKVVKAPTEFRGQWGITQDDYGRHYFNDNWTAIQTTSFLPSVSHRNKDYIFPTEVMQQLVGTNVVFPVRVTPGINRGYNMSMYDEAYKLKRHTSAGGPLFYRGSQFPSEFYGMLLTPESAGNLVKATKTVEIDGVVSGQDMFPHQSIIASTDERFRPVNTIDAPDGTITLLDLYHGIVQHRGFLTTYLRKQIESRSLQNNPNTGRIYRIFHNGSPLEKPSYLSGLNAYQLTAYLSHRNGWHRDKAQQLLVMSQDKSVSHLLGKIAINSKSDITRIKALWTLEGLDAIDFDLLKLVLNNYHPKVARSVYRLAETIDTTPELEKWLNAQSENITREASGSFALLAGQHKQWHLLTKIINEYGISPFVFAAMGSHGKAYLQQQGSNIVEASNVETITQVVMSKKGVVAKTPLTDRALESYNRGETLYTTRAACFGCHGANGEGNAVIPPLNQSEWVVGSKNRLIAILLHGLSGPIEVKGKIYDTAMTMPGLANNTSINDQDIADIATYIRYAWSNEASDTVTKEVAKVRAATAMQSIPYANEQLLQHFD